MAATYRPFERLPDPAMLWTAVPRGLRGFIVNTALLDLKPINDQQLLTLSATLPNGFAYVFAGVHLGIAQNRAGDWNDNYTLNLQNWYQGELALSSSWIMPWLDGLVGGTGPPVEKNTSAHSMDSLPKAPMYAPTGVAGILISIQAENQQATAATAGTVNAYINFWEFDLEQARKFPINAPIPTHSR